MRIESDIKLDFSDVLIKPKRSELSSRKDAVLERKFTFKHSLEEWKGIPIIAANMDHVGTPQMAGRLSLNNMLTAACKFSQWSKFQEYSWHRRKQESDQLNHPPIQNYVIQTIGLDRNLDNMDYDDAEWICLDVANGYTERFFEFVSLMRNHEATRRKIIIAGNVCTPEAVEQTLLAGADIVKVGIGPGSVCTTRKMTGVGYPQLSCIDLCSDAAHGLGGHIIADGGCVVPGDIAKAFGAGADFVMIGGMLSGHDECQGEKVMVDGEQKMKFRGMSSEDAQIDHYGAKEEYRASEGKVVYVPCKGPVQNTVNEILGGLRSSMTYAGARSIKDMPKCCTFIRVNNQLNESLS